MRAGAIGPDLVAAAYERWQRACRSGSPLRTVLFKHYMAAKDAADDCGCGMGDECQEDTYGR